MFKDDPGGSAKCRRFMPRKKFTKKPFNKQSCFQSKNAGGDSAPEFQGPQRFREEPSEVFLQTARGTAEHNLEITYYRAARDMWEQAKRAAMTSAEEARRFDKLIREFFSNEPRILFEWDQFMAQWDFVDEDEIVE